MSDTAAADDTLRAIELSRLDCTEYDRRRVAEAEKMGVRVATLDKLVDDARKGAAAKERRPALFEDPEPWPEPVRTAELLDLLAETVRRHVVLSGAAADAVALWIAHTWVFPRFQHTPRLAVTSPAKRCGKSALLNLLSVLTCRALKVDNVSAAAMFRVIEAHQPTLAIDEADSFLGDREELRGILNSGFEERGRVIRVEERDGEHVPCTFSTFAPVAIAAIGRLPGTLADRSVPVALKRKLPHEIVVKMRHSRLALAEAARRLARWATDAAADLSPDPDVPEALNDRQGDISVPLLSIADHAGEGWGRRARVSLLTVFEAGAEAEEAGAEASTQMLLTDIRTAFEVEGEGGRISSDGLVTFLWRLDDRPWGEMDRGKPITARQLARRLAPFGIKPKPQRVGGDLSRGYDLADFADALARYLPVRAASSPQEGAAAVTPETPQEAHGVSSGPASVTPPAALHTAKGSKPLRSQACYAVTHGGLPVEGR